MDGATSAGFSGNPQSLSPNGTGFTYYFNDDPPAQRSADTDQDSLKRYLASPDGSANPGQKRVDNDFSTLAYAGPLPTKAPPPAVAAAAPRDWLAWGSVRGTDYFRGTFGDDLKGDQVDALAGLTRRIMPNFVVGAFAGYENFNYSSQAFDSVLKGDDWTAGAYLGWKLARNLRFDAGGAWSDIFADDTAGTANGNFTGTRWLVNGGLTGTYPWQQYIFEPPARVFALWEHENAFIDSLGTLQAARNFETARQRRRETGVSLRLDQLGGAVTLCRPLCRLLFLAGRRADDRANNRAALARLRGARHRRHQREICRRRDDRGRRRVWRHRALYAYLDLDRARQHSVLTSGLS